MKEKTKLQQWLRHSKVGESIVYYTGFLWRDRRDTQKLLVGNKPWTISNAVKGVDDVGTLMWGAYLKGAVSLVQRKLGKGKYEYIAQKRRHK